MFHGWSTPVTEPLESPYPRSSPWLCASALQTRRFTTCSPKSARHLVGGAALLAEMLGEGNDRERIAQRMRDAEHAADETTHRIMRRVNTTFVTPFDREDIYALASALDDIMDFMEEAVDLTLLYEVDHAALGARQPGRGDPALRGAHRRVDAPAAQHAGSRGVLDRDQPSREPRRQELPTDPRQAVQRQVRGTRGAQAQGHRRLPGGRDRRVREGRATSSSSSPSRSPEGGPRDRHRGGR